MTDTEAPTQIPDRAPALIPGRSAYAENRVMGIWVLVAAACFVAELAVIALVQCPARDIAVPCVTAAAVLAGIALFRATLRVNAALRRERAAGYTTSYGDRYQHLWQLDPDSGAVVRRPGEPAVTRWNRRGDR